MSRRRQIGAALMGLGAMVLVIAAIATFTGGDDSSAAPTTAASESPATTAAPTTTGAGSTTPTSGVTTSTGATTSSTAGTTSTTVAPLGPQDAVSFIEEFAAAIAAGDVDFLFDRLHTVVLRSFDPEVCRPFIEREILALQNYRVSGDVATQSRTYTVSDGEVVVDPLFLIPVTFTFQGQEFDGSAGLAEEDGEMRWFTECR